MNIGRLHVLTDFFYQQRLGHADLVQAVVEGGADTIQFRQKHGLLRHKYVEAAAAAAVCREAGVTYLVDDHIDIALLVGANGIHLGQEDIPIDVARRLLGPDMLIGGTVSSVAQAVRAWKDGADYLGFGPVFETYSKASPEKVRGVDALAAVVEAVPIPVVAIAGITKERVREALEAGAHGVAVMTAITTAPDPGERTAAFRREIDGWLADSGKGPSEGDGAQP